MNRQPAHRQGQERRGSEPGQPDQAEAGERPRPAVPLVPADAATCPPRPNLCARAGPEQTCAQAHAAPGDTAEGGKGLQGTARALGAGARRGPPPHTPDTRGRVCGAHMGRARPAPSSEISRRQQVRLRKELISPGSSEAQQRLLWGSKNWGSPSPGRRRRAGGHSAVSQVTDEGGSETESVTSTLPSDRLCCTRVSLITQPAPGQRAAGLAGRLLSVSATTGAVGLSAPPPSGLREAQAALLWRLMRGTGRGRRTPCPRERRRALPCAPRRPPAAEPAPGSGGVQSLCRRPRRSPGLTPGPMWAGNTAVISNQS